MIFFERMNPTGNKSVVPMRLVVTLVNPFTGGAVRGVSWCGSLLAWATDVSVRVFDLNLKTTIALVQRDHSAA